MKDLLDKKNTQEIEQKRKKRYGANMLSIMEDFQNIIMLDDFSEQEIKKMLDRKNLLEDLVVLWQDDERVLELQERILREFLFEGQTND